MKRALFALAVAAAATSPAFAQLDLAQSKNCLTCHAVDKKLVGPAYKDVAAKYAGQKGAEDKLVQKVMKGGSGVMPLSLPSRIFQSTGFRPTARTRILARPTPGDGSSSSSTRNTSGGPYRS